MKAPAQKAKPKSSQKSAPRRARTSGIPIAVIGEGAAGETCIMRGTLIETVDVGVLNGGPREIQIKVRLKAFEMSGERSSVIYRTRE